MLAKNGRPAKLTKEQVLIIRVNPDKLSNKELMLRFGISMPTLLDAKFGRGAYAALA